MIRYSYASAILASAAAFALAGGPAQSAMSGNAMPMGKEMPMAKGAMPMPMSTGSLTVLSPRNGATITTTDIPVRVTVSNFRLCGLCAGMGDAPNTGHIHVMFDGMSMAKLFNFYTTTIFTLPGRGLTPGEHTLIFDLASDTHEDFANTVKKVTVNYQPARAEGLRPPLDTAGEPVVKFLSPRSGATVGPRFTLRVQTLNFRPSLALEGKPDIKGYGHLHVFVDMQPMSMSGNMSEMMSMAGMIAMPGSDVIPVDLSYWPNGKHTITVMPVQNDHTPIMGAKEAMITINLTGARAGR